MVVLCPPGCSAAAADTLADHPGRECWLGCGFFASTGVFWRYWWILERIHRELRSGCFLELTAALYDVCVKALNVDLGLHL